MLLVTTLKLKLGRAFFLPRFFRGSVVKNTTTISTVRVVQ